MVDETSGLPVPSVFVQLLERDGRAVAASMTDSAGAFTLTAPRPGETDESGTFLFCNVPSGEMTIEASIGSLREVFTIRMPENGFLRF
ncbi:MAG: hypothetical protein PVJ76_14495, partial [Gemmatimonadota bacterium]